MNLSSTPPAKGKNGRFGTFGGVFTPSLLTILGVIMYLRANYVVGQAGIRTTLIILTLSSAITFLTSLSIAAIATNTPVGGGGAYFLISRSLGPQFGGSIGLALYFGQALSVPFYVLGFTNALIQTFPPLASWFTPIMLGTLTLLFAVNFIGADWAIKTQYVVMAILGISIFVFLAGAAGRFDSAQFTANWASQYTGREIGFWSMFAIYFPAVTGILAGVNMSGDLKDPARSLVRGTLAAVGVGFLIYAAQILLCGGSQSREDLIARPYEMLVRNALMGAGFLVVPGVFAATLSSAIGSLLGAPRVLQAFARDALLPGVAPFARGAGRGDEPRVALWLTFAISLLVIGLASRNDATSSLDTVASVVSMFFLCTYGMINLAAFVESFSLNPSFRPRFRLFHWTLALAGAGACLVIMLQIDPAAAGGAVLVVAAIYAVINRRESHAAFGDARRGFLFALVSRSLRALQRIKPDPKNWRPTILVLSGSPHTRFRLLEFGALLEARRGMVTAAQVLPGDPVELMPRRQTEMAALELFMREKGLSAFPEVVAASDLDEGMRMLIQAHSIGAIKPNTVLLGWPRDPARIAPYQRHVRDFRALGRSVICLLDGTAHSDHGSGRRIDIWSRDMENTSLMLVLAYLLTRNWEWRHARLRMLRIAPPGAATAQVEQELRTLLDAGRMTAEVMVLQNSGAFEEQVAAHSADADFTFVDFRTDTELDAAFFARFETLRQKLKMLVLVCSSGEADLKA